MAAETSIWVVLGLGVWAVVSLLYGWRRGFFSWKKLPPRWGKENPVSFLIFAEAVLIYLIVQFSFVLFGASGLVSFGWMTIGGGVAALGALLIFLSLVRGGILGRVWGKRIPLWSGMFAWLLAFPTCGFVGQGLGMFITWITGEGALDQAAVEQLKALRAFPTLYVAMSIFIVVIVPVVEELLFRGLLQTWLRRYLSRWPSVAISAALFALAHMTVMQGWTNVAIVAQLFVLGLFLGLLYEREESLWSPIGLHATFNLIAALVLSLD